MAETTMTIGGITLERRASGTIGQARAVSRLKLEYGIDLLTGIEPAGFESLIYRPGGVRALLAVLFTGPLDDLDEDALTVVEVREALEGFFGNGGQPSTGQPAGSPSPSDPPDSAS